MRFCRSALRRRSRSKLILYSWTPFSPILMSLASERAQERETQDAGSAHSSISYRGRNERPLTRVNFLQLSLKVVHHANNAVRRSQNESRAADVVDFHAGLGLSLSLGGHGGPSPRESRHAFSSHLDCAWDSRLRRTTTPELTAPTGQIRWRAINASQAKCRQLFREFLE